MAKSFGTKSRRGSRILSYNLEVEKFDGTNNFGVWPGEIRDLLAMQDLGVSLEVMLEDMIDAE